jgi:hypothetical protein
MLSKIVDRRVRGACVGVVAALALAALPAQAAASQETLHCQLSTHMSGDWGIQLSPSDASNTSGSYILHEQPGCTLSQSDPLYSGIGYPLNSGNIFWPLLQESGTYTRAPLAGTNGGDCSGVTTLTSQSAVVQQYPGGPPLPGGEGTISYSATTTITSSPVFPWYPLIAIGRVSASGVSDSDGNPGGSGGSGTYTLDPSQNYGMCTIFWFDGGAASYINLTV